jgi:hypothetical protein
LQETAGKSHAVSSENILPKMLPAVLERAHPQISPPSRGKAFEYRLDSPVPLYGLRCPFLENF